jgi:hypothetical protein
VLSAIERIASLIQAERDQQAHRPIADSLDLPEAISASWSPQPQPGPAALLPPYITSPAPSDLSALAERLQDIAWTMRERGFDSAICDEIESVASRIPAAPVTHGSEEHHRQAIPADDPTTVEPGFPLDREPTDEPEASVGLERVRLGTPDIASLIRATSDSLCARSAGLAAPAEHEETDPLLDLEQELFAPSPANATPNVALAPSRAPGGAEPTSAVAAQDALAIQAVTAGASEQTAVSGIPTSMQPAAAPSAPVRPAVTAMPRAAAYDPLAALKAPTDEECIALFT